MNLSFDPDAAAELLSAFESHTHAVHGTVTDLDGPMTALHGEWSGTSQQAHAETHRGWAGRMSRSHDRATATLSDARETAARLVRAEEDATALWR